MLTLIKAWGWLLAQAPESGLRILAALLGDGVFFLFRRRRRLILSNLDHAFPGKPAEWQRRIGRECCRRLIETAFLSLATPYLPDKRLKEIIKPAPNLLRAYELQKAEPRATLICTCHIAYWEAQTSMPLIVPAPFPEFGTIYRPLDNAAADEWVRRSREHFGMKLLSRKEGFAEALKILRRRGFIGMLFDQNAGMQGALTTMFGRVCSTSELPGILAAKFDARVYGIFPRRHGFWRLEIAAEAVETTGGQEGVTIALNRWLESLITRDDDLTSSWLWAHDRWRHQDVPERRLRLESRRNLLAADTAARGIGALPRKTRIWLRLPNWLGDVIMLLPLLRAMRVSRPDAEFTLVGRPQFQELIESTGVADHYHPLPSQGAGYFLHFRALREKYIDAYILFTHSFRGDLEARLTCAPQRFGILRSGKSRPLLTHSWQEPAGDSATRHQKDDWDGFLRHFGLNAPADNSPVGRPLADASTREASASGRPTIGLIPGSENNPAKRWPVSHWRSVIEAFPDCHFILFGTAGDVPITAAVAAGFPSDRVSDQAGKTTLLQLADRLRECSGVVTNDTGGMHLANAVGTPVIALFGPTNPRRTGPVFDSPVTILQPPGCAPTGGGNLAAIDPKTVTAEIRLWLNRQ